MDNIAALLESALKQGFSIKIEVQPPKDVTPNVEVVTGEKSLIPRKNSRQLRLQKATEILETLLSNAVIADSADVLSWMAEEGFGRNIAYEASQRLDVAKKVVFVNGHKTWTWRLKENNGGRGGLQRKAGEATLRDVFAKKSASVVPLETSSVSDSILT